MRLSVLDGDPGFNPELARRVRVLLDGEDITTNCMTADEETGTALIYVRDPSGRVMVTGYGQPACIVVRGSVSIHPLQ